MQNESNWIFLRGLMRESRHWGSFPELFRKNMPGAHIHMIDIPGNGLNFDRGTPLTIKGIMEDVRLQYRRRGTNSKIPTYIISISMGSMIAVEWASRHPEELAGIVLMNTSFSSLSPIYKRVQPKSVVAGINVLRTSERVARERQILKLTTNLLRDADKVAEEYAGYSKEYPISLLSCLRQLAAASRYRLPKKKPKTPALVLIGDRDRFVDPSCSHALVEKWDLDFHSHPTAGHDLPLDAPDWVAGRIHDWLELNETV